MAEATLQITITKAGDPEKLGALFKAALDAQDFPEPAERLVVPDGYRCVECYADDGGHESGCSVGMTAHRNKETSRAA
jgi:hypothetical protein